MKLFLRNSFLSLIIFVCFYSQAKSQFLTTGNGTTTVGSAGLVCLGTFLDPLNINTPSMTDWVDFRLAAGVGCTYWIHSSLSDVADAGTYAGFHLRSVGLLSLLGGVEVRTYLSGQLQESASGASLLSLLTGEEGDIYFTSTKPYNELRLVVSSLLGLAYNINIFYGFGSRNLPNTIVLPMQILEFQAKRVFDDVEVSGVISSDENIESMVVERSSDGRYFRQEAASVVRAGNSFRFRVADPAQAFFRVKITTAAGSYYSSISAVPAVQAQAKMQVVSLGNQPCLLLPAGSGAQVSIALYDIAGRTYYNQRHNLQGHAQINLPGNLAKGNIYCVSVTDENGQRQTKKFVL